jgi:hypothetical protein
LDTFEAVVGVYVGVHGDGVDCEKFGVAWYAVGILFKKLFSDVRRVSDVGGDMFL